MAKGRSSLDFSDPLAVRRWLDDVQENTDEVLAVAQDQTKPLAERDLGRAQAVRILTEVAESLTRLLVFARRGLPPAAHIDSPGAPDSSRRSS